MSWTSELLVGRAWKLVDGVQEHLQYKEFSHWQLTAANPVFWKESVLFEPQK